MTIRLKNRIDMKESIDELKQAFRYAKTDKERDAIDVKMQQLINQNPDEFAQAMVDSAKETAIEVTNLAMRQKLENVIPAISLVYIAKKNLMPGCINASTEM